ncbi:MAG TPA: hypothetical protein VJZ27_20000, partial [Aggregatilineales bacterium]|nr:hypothetical protein [Aggregatilineales bacterium]
FGWVDNQLGYNEETGESVFIEVPAGEESDVWSFNALIWEENGRIIRVISNSLDRETLLEVAKSLQ